MTADMDAYNQSRAYEIYIGTITLMVLASIAVTARLAARKISVANYWWDDYLIALALVRTTRLASSARTTLLNIPRSSTGHCRRALGLALRRDSVAILLLMVDPSNPMISLYTKK